MRKYIEKINKSIEIVFFAIFLTTPLAMHPATSELFEFNKMWLVYIYSLIIFFLWGTKIILQRKFEIRRTFFDIPLLLFLLSQFISTIFSIDSYTSFWGYYSRFNGGLLSTICYIFLFYAFSTNILTSDKTENLKRTGRMIYAIFIAGIVVALWGFPSHFGYDPTCLVFRGSLDVACWTDAFQPKVRMFSTLGQPNWLAAYLLVLLPICMSYVMHAAKSIKKNNLFSLPLLKTVLYSVVAFLFYFDLNWTLSQSGFIGFWIGNLIFVIISLLLISQKGSFSIIEIFKNKSFQALIALQFIFILTTFLTQNPIPSLNKYGFKALIEKTKEQTVQLNEPASTKNQEQPAGPSLESNITGSGEIRKIVWRGALDIWKAYPLFGSGVETYAFAYYKFRPIEHNLTSEWDYLYNKAHNEFLNYLATTGAFGLGTYLLFIFSFLLYAIKDLIAKLRKNTSVDFIFPALIGAFVGIQISNFFGFSVVFINLLTFLIPVFYFALSNTSAKLFTLPKSNQEEYITSEKPGTGRIMVILALSIYCLYSIGTLINYWNADISYSYGFNYNRINQFQQAYSFLENATKLRSGEYLFKNELSVNLAALSLIAAQQNNATLTAQLANQSKALSDEVIKANPNNVVYWKARTRIMFSLSELDPKLMQEAIIAIENAHKLAPTDAKVMYNQALIYDQAGRKEEGLKILNQTIKVKKDYRDAYYAKALFLSQLADTNKNDSVKALQLKNEAIDTLNYLLKNISPNDQQAKDLLITLK